MPIPTDYWPVTPGTLLASAEADRYQRPGDTADVCFDGRSDWICTREVDHELPHVAMSGRRVCAVWDQQFYGSKHQDGPVPLTSVGHYPNARRRTR